MVNNKDAVARKLEELAEAHQKRSTVESKNAAHSGDSIARSSENPNKVRGDMDPQYDIERFERRLDKINADIRALKREKLSLLSAMTAHRRHEAMVSNAQVEDVEPEPKESLRVEDNFPVLRTEEVIAGSDLDVEKVVKQASETSEKLNEVPSDPDSAVE